MALYIKREKSGDTFLTKKKDITYFMHERHFELGFMRLTGRDNHLEPGNQVLTKS